jgi:hypothetical protein
MSEGIAASRAGELRPANISKRYFVLYENLKSPLWGLKDFFKKSWRLTVFRLRISYCPLQALFFG